jgi:hypothetical protein
MFHWEVLIRPFETSFIDRGMIHMDGQTVVAVLISLKKEMQYSGVTVYYE